MELANEITNKLWPPAYTVRRSTKAKRIHLKISPSRGLEIVVPLKRKTVDLEKILEERRKWIEKWFKRFSLSQLENREKLPRELCLLAIDKIMTVHYQQEQRQRFLLKEEDKTLTIIGNLENEAQCLLILKKWLKKQAHIYLVSWIANLSQETGLKYTELSIRNQSTLWGSCNAAKKITLNYKLLFLPSALVRYVLLHELCHLRYLDHSKNFWFLLEKYDQNYQEHRKILRKTEADLPVWLEL